MSIWLNPNQLSFPPLERALKEPNGFLAAGGDLSVARLIAAYRHGCFPWFSQGDPIMWWSPNPRMVLLPQELHIPRSLRKTIKQQRFNITYNQAFAQVIAACAEANTQRPSTWITKHMQQAYQELHCAGYAHSVEAWQDGELVGGLYGVAIGCIFYGESMFTRVADASKCAFVHLVEDLHAANYQLIDCQMHTQHLARFGAKEIERCDFAAYLAKYCPQTSSFNWPPPSQ